MGLACAERIETDAGFSVTCMSLKGYARRRSSQCKYVKSYSSR
jgi:hypothetical protein